MRSRGILKLLSLCLVVACGNESIGGAVSRGGGQKKGMMGSGGGTNLIDVSSIISVWTQPDAGLLAGKIIAYNAEN